MPGVPSSFFLFLVRLGVPSSVLAPNSEGLQKQWPLTASGPTLGQLRNGPLACSNACSIGPKETCKT